MRYIEERSGVQAGRIDIAKVTATYCGSTGCACGCGGNYAGLRDKPRAVKTRINKINNNLDSVIVDVWDEEMIYELQSGNRVTRVYVAV